MSGDLAVGESQVWSLSVGLDPDPRSAAACHTQVQVPAPSVLQREVPEWAVHAWDAHLTVRAATLEKIELEVDWKRLVRGSDAQPRVVAEDSRAVTLGEGQHRLLDFVSVPSVPSWEACFSNLALELEARIAEDPALANRRIGYDLWLVDEGPGGSPTTRRWQVAGKQGEARDFEFEPLRRQTGGGAAAQAVRVRIDTRVSGKVRGRVRSDGTVEVALAAQRMDSGGEDVHWAIGGSGEKRVQVAAGETIRLELPAPREAPRHPGESAAEIEADQRILAGLRERTVSLVLTARPVE